MSYLGTTTYPIVTLPELVTDSLGYQPVDANTVTQLNTTTGNYANSAYATANTADQKAVTSGVYANSAYAAANTADQKAVSSGVYANSAFGVANTASVNATSAGSYANGAYTQANTATTNAATADQRAVTSGVYANSAFATANSKTSNVGTVTSVGATGTVNGLTLTGTVTTSGNLTLGGTLDLSSPPAIGGVTANTGTFSNLSYTGTLTGGTGVINIGSGQIYKDASGNVGIGITPSVKFEVGGGAASNVVAIRSTAETGSALLYTVNSNASVAQWYVGHNGIDVDTGNLRAGALKFVTNSSEKMRIQSGGDVGIGTASPASKLHVVGSFRQTGATVPFEWTVNSGAADFYKLNAVGFADNLIVANSSGNVGIGTVSPTGKLDLFTSATAGSISNLTFSANNAASAKKDYVQFAPTIEFNTAGSEAGGYVLKVLQQGAYKNSIVATGITNNSGNYLAFSTTNEAMRIDTSGNVGIGTSSPASKLEVTGDVQQTWAASMDRFVGSKFSTTYELGVHFLESSRETRLVSKAADSTGLISFYTGVTPTERMRINSDGTLLVLTTVAPATSWNTNSRVNIKAGVQLTHTGNANTWRQLSWSGDTADTTLFFPSQAGNVPSLSAAGAWTNASDGRLKTNVRTIEHGLASVITAKPRSYTRTDCAGNYIGFVAQELKEIIPEVVLGSEETQYGVDYGSLVAVAFKAIQEQQTMIEELRAEIQLLKTQ